MSRKKEYESAKDIAKVSKLLGVGVKDDLDAMDERALRTQIISAEASIRETEAEMKSDDRLSGAKEIVKDLSSAYRDAKKAQTAKIKYALYRLAETGKL